MVRRDERAGVKKAEIEWKVPHEQNSQFEHLFIGVNGFAGDPSHLLVVAQGNLESSFICWGFIYQRYDTARTLISYGSESEGVNPRRGLMEVGGAPYPAQHFIIRQEAASIKGHFYGLFASLSPRPVADYNGAVAEAVMKKSMRW